MPPSASCVPHAKSHSCVWSFPALRRPKTSAQDGAHEAATRAGWRSGQSAVPSLQGGVCEPRLNLTSRHCSGKIRRQEEVALHAAGFEWISQNTRGSTTRHSTGTSVYDTGSSYQGQLRYCTCTVDLWSDSKISGLAQMSLFWARLYTVSPRGTRSMCSKTVVC